jgi:molybdate/tungstate transport system substrate-binding protein
MLAAKLYKQANLVEKVLGPAINKEQIFTEPTVQARLQSGELDAASAYKIQPEPFHLPYIALPDEINLSGETVRVDYADVSLFVGGKTYSPEPLTYYAAVLRGAPNPKGALLSSGGSQVTRGTPYFADIVTTYRRTPLRFTHEI